MTRMINQQQSTLTYIRIYFSDDQSTNGCDADNTGAYQS
jgi:hypothetical protein